MYTESSHLVFKQEVATGQQSWRSPSNIALIKYWGKYGDQLPRNPSLSFTLTESYSETTVSYGPKKSSERISFEFLFDGQNVTTFSERVGSYLEKLIPFFPFVEQMHFDIRSSNSFPHSSGIASSASAFSALALCLCSIEHACFDTLEDDTDFRQKSSYIARLGSGSACRSVFDTCALWGKIGEAEGSADEFAVGLKGDLHPEFLHYHNAILIIESKSKEVSSSAGHQLMEDHAFAQIRYAEARKNLHLLLEALRTGDHAQFGSLVEVEAMQLHAMMMTSRPHVMLLAPNTLKVIQLVKEFRKSTGHPLYFTIDAGPNLHLLYPEKIRPDVLSFVESVLTPYCQMGSWIDDRVGEGPVQIS